VPEREGALEPARNNDRSAAVAAPVDPGTVRVVDGDTLDVAGMRVRIADIDTPEVFSPRCRREADLGARATRRLRALIDEGPFDLVPIARDEDRYGRKLRIAARDGRSLGDRLVAEGLARTYDGGRRAGWCA
jgi:endonuclease YncB( thermonuclease family)